MQDEDMPKDAPSSPSDTCLQADSTDPETESETQSHAGVGGLENIGPQDSGPVDSGAPMESEHPVASSPVGSASEMSGPGDRYPRRSGAKRFRPVIVDSEDADEVSPETHTVVPPPEKKRQETDPARKRGSSLPQSSAFSLTWGATGRRRDAGRPGAATTRPGAATTRPGAATTRPGAATTRAGRTSATPAEDALATHLQAQVSNNVRLAHELVRTTKIAPASLPQLLAIAKDFVVNTTAGGG